MSAPAKTKRVQRRQRLADGRYCSTLRACFLFHSHPDEATRLWEDGCRPILGQDIRPGDRLLTRQEWFGMGCGVINTKTVRAVEWVEEMGALLIDLGDCDEAYAEELQEVWVVLP